MIQNLTHAECGAILMATGHVMMQNDLCADAAAHDDFDEVRIALMFEHGDIEPARARELCEAELSEVIDFINIT